MTIALSMALTLACYAVGLIVRKKTNSPLAVPVVVATALAALNIVASRMDYQTYASDNAWIVWMLGPATVALGVGLAKNIRLLKGSMTTIIIGVLTGVVATTGCAMIMGTFMHLPHELILAFSLKATTTAVALDMAKTLGLNPVVVTVTVLTSGMLGAIAGPTIFRLAKVKTTIERGVATGAVAHGIGTAQIASEDATAGAFSGLAMSLGALVVAVGAPFVVNILGK